MKIGIIGSGGMGAALGRAWVRAGHEVLFSFARDPERLAQLAEHAGQRATTGTPDDAVRFGDAVMLAVPWTAVPEAIAAAGALDGVVVVECTNPLAPDLTGLVIGHSSCASEEVAQLAPGATVVKAFNSVFAELVEQPAAAFGTEVPSVFYATDDPDAKRIAATLIQACGFEAINVPIPGVDGTVGQHGRSACLCRCGGSRNKPFRAATHRDQGLRQPGIRRPREDRRSPRELYRRRGSSSTTTASGVPTFGHCTAVRQPTVGRDRWGGRGMPLRRVGLHGKTIRSRSR